MDFANAALNSIRRGLMREWMLVKQKTRISRKRYWQEQAEFFEESFTSILGAYNRLRKRVVPFVHSQSFVIQESENGAACVEKMKDLLAFELFLKIKEQGGIRYEWRQALVEGKQRITVTALLDVVKEAPHE